MKNISFEFFPTKTDEGSNKLAIVRDKLGKCNPDYFSVTYGAGGTTQDGTLNTALAIQKAGFNVAPHLSCIGSSREHLREILTTYKSHNINRIVSLRGDLPSGTHDLGELHYANQLVEFIRQETGDYFHIEVAAYPEFHPQAINSKSDFQHFEAKMKAGANSAITQYFFNSDAYLYFRDDCLKAGINQPIIPGIMPIVNFTRLSNFSSMCGAEIPAWMRKRFEAYGEDSDAIKSYGLEIISNLCQQLIGEGVPGIHFYTLNQAETTLKIIESIN
jgi:methylenetetrahydrofolate reductase (NADPH)